VKCGLKRWHQLPKLIHRETGQITYLCRAGLEISEPYSSYGGGLLSLEAQHTINRDELYYQGLCSTMAQRFMTECRRCLCQAMKRSSNAPGVYGPCLD
jgi:hypothetical protein